MPVYDRSNANEYKCLLLNQSVNLTLMRRAQHVYCSSIVPKPTPSTTLLGVACGPRARPDAQYQSHWRRWRLKMTCSKVIVSALLGAFCTATHAGAAAMATWPI